jgi:hypothetical protein
MAYTLLAIIQIGVDILIHDAQYSRKEIENGKKAGDIAQGRM